ncbi:GNAT family N-acetyltransferase [Cytobacillus sp. Hm23]
MKTRRITTENELKTAFHIRTTVFVEEQGVPLEDEFDEYDQLNGKCDHVLVFINDEAVGTGRIRFVDGQGKLERICVLAPYRKFGVGKVIIQALEEIAEDKQITRVKLHGQTQAEGFYKKLGYDILSDVFMEDGIPHVLMGKGLNVSSSEQ